MHSTPAAGLLLCACVAVLPAITGCGGDANGDGHEVVVFAAASLTEAFGEMGDEFEAAHPDTSVAFSFTGSSTLAAQISRGAPADVFASANDDIMAQAHDDGDVAEPVELATNSLVIAVEPGNPMDIDELDDLADPDLAVLLCAPEVPCGSLGAETLASAGVEVTPSSYEADVKAVVTKVALGEADAGLVYRTDAAAAGDELESVSLGDDSPTTTYEVAAVASGANPSGADAFIDFANGAAGREILASHGFGQP